MFFAHPFVYSLQDNTGGSSHESFDVTATDYQRLPFEPNWSVEIFIKFPKVRSLPHPLDAVDTPVPPSRRVLVLCRPEQRPIILIIAKISDYC